MREKLVTKLKERTYLLIIILFLVNLLAAYFRIYYTLPGFDKAVHFLGGITVGVGCLFFLVSRGMSSRVGISAMLLALGIGVAWEVCEYVTAFSFHVPYSSSDGMTDIVADALGVIVSWVIYARDLARLKL